MHDMACERWRRTLINMYAMRVQKLRVFTLYPPYRHVCDWLGELWPVIWFDLLYILYYTILSDIRPCTTERKLNAASHRQQHRRSTLGEPESRRVTCMRCEIAGCPASRALDWWWNITVGVSADACFNLFGRCWSCRKGVVNWLNRYI